MWLADTPLPPHTSMYVALVTATHVMQETTDDLSHAAGVYGSASRL